MKYAIWQSDVSNLKVFSCRDISNLWVILLSFNYDFYTAVKYQKLQSTGPIELVKHTLIKHLGDNVKVNVLASVFDKVPLLKTCKFIAQRLRRSSWWLLLIYLYCKSCVFWVSMLYVSLFDFRYLYHLIFYDINKNL